MAFKRTILRQNFVTNTAMPESAGHAMAQASRDIAGAITHITNTVDKNEFETFKLQAEKEGKIIGQRTEVVDGKNVIKPLDLESLGTFKPNMYNKANQRKIQEYFKEQAINSYSLALSNDAINASETSLITNKGKVDDKGNLLVNSASEAYLKAIKNKVPLEVWNNISPGLEKIWGVSNRKASAYQIEDVRNLNYSNAVKTLDYVNNYEQNLIINGGDETDLLYVEEVKQKAFQLIDDNAKSSADASNIKIAYSTQLQTGVSQNAVTMAHGSGASDADLLKMAETTKQQYQLDKNINSDAVYKSMINEINRLQKIDTEIKQDTKNNSVISKYKMLLNLPKNIYPTENEMLNLELEDQLQVEIAISAKQKLIKTDNVKTFNDDVMKSIFAVKHNDFNVIEEFSDTGNDYTSDDIKWLRDRKKISLVQDVVKKIGNRLLNVTTLDKIYGLTKELADSYATEQSDVFKANMTLAMSGNTDFTLIPSQLRDPKYIEKLVKNNIIGNKKYHAYTRDGWINVVNNYDKEFKNSNITANVLSKIGWKMENQVPINPSEQKELEKVLPKTFPHNGQKVEFDVLNENADVRQTSIEFYTGQALSTGYVPKDLKEIFDNIQTSKDDTNFAYTKIAYFSLKDEFYKNKGEDADRQWEIFAGKDRNDLDLSILDTSQNYADASEFASRNSNVSQQRNLNEMFPQLKGSDLTERDIVVDGIHKVLENSDNYFWQKWFVSDVDGKETENNVVSLWLDQQNISWAGNFDNAIINQPEIINEIIKGVKYRARNNKLNMDYPEKALMSAIKSEFYNFTGQLSLNKDKTGNVHLIKGVSALRNAQSKVPGNAVTLTKSDLIKDVLKDYNATFGGGTQNEFIKEAIDNEDLMFIPNNEIGSKTYRVVAFGIDGVGETIANNYTWEWENSQSNADYKDALQKISDGGVRKVLSSFNFMSKNNLDAVMSSIKNNREQAETWKSLIATYNKIAISVNNAPTIPSKILPYFQSEKGQKELEEYFDDKRFLRFNLR